jgi:hypothetical protein
MLTRAGLTSDGEFAHNGAMKRTLPTHAVNLCGVIIISS